MQPPVHTFATVARGRSLCVRCGLGVIGQFMGRIPPCGAR